jgi:hypothetical protein
MLLKYHKNTFLGRIIGLFRLSYLTPGLMAAGVTEVIVEKEQVSVLQNFFSSTPTVRKWGRIM